MSVTLFGTTEPGLRTSIIHEPSEKSMFTVAPRDNGGDGSTFSPTDLVGAALASCVATTAELYAKKHNLSLTRVHFVVDKEMTTGIPRRVAKLTLKVGFEGVFSPEEFDKICVAAGRCPVKLSLHPEVVVEEHFYQIEKK